MVDRSYNGWPVIDSRSLTQKIEAGGHSWYVAPGDVAVVFKAFIQDFVAHVEQITGPVLDDWSHAVRPVRGTEDRAVTSWSCHASGTAIDINALDHMRGLRGTFSPTQRVRLAELLDKYDVLRWGGNFSTTPDEMHFEIAVGPLTLAAFVRTLGVPQTTVTNPGRVPPVVAGKEYTVNDLPVLRVGSSRAWDVRRLQGLLIADRAVVSLAIDGDFGPKTEAGVKKLQAARGVAVDGIVGPKTWAALLGLI